MDKEISSKIKILGFFMTCAVVFYHCSNFDNSLALGPLDVKLNTLVGSIFNQLGYLAMCHFFCVTGYLLFYNYSFKDYGSKIKRRVFSLLLPYVVWQCIIALVDVLQDQYVFSFSDFLTKTFCLVRWPQDGPVWYVYAVFLMALVSPVLLLFFRNKKVSWCVTLILIVAIQASGKITNPLFVSILNHGYVGNIQSYLPSYLIGCFCGKFANENTKTESLSFLLSALLVAFFLDETLPGFFPGLAIKLMPMMLLYVLPVIPALEDRKIYGLSFLIYAMHQPLIADTWQYYYPALAQIPIPLWIRSIIVRFIVLGLDIGLAVIIHIVLKRFAPKLLQIITGGRAK